MEVSNAAAPPFHTAMAPTVKSDPAAAAMRHDRNADGQGASGPLRANPAGGQPDSAHLEQLRTLRQRDREVRAHELAHLSAAGTHARGGASFTYEVGPDGRRYAVGGEVQIDTAPVPGDPQATLAKAQQILRAALAPANPSAQDRKVAAQAAAMAARARGEVAQAAGSIAENALAGTGYNDPIAQAPSLVEVIV